MDSYKLTKFFLKVYIKMEKTIIKFGDIEIEKTKISPIQKTYFNVEIFVGIKNLCYEKNFYDFFYCPGKSHFPLLT